MASTVQYSVSNGDFYTYLLGAWKRNLNWIELGRSFSHLRTSNSVILIEEKADAAAEPETRFLNWKVGASLDEDRLRIETCMQFIPDENGTMRMEW
eukprot:CAMPEP_0117736718 /NCGR_PEP_ID=MMETSP0947-20121206/2102_1 /TAXON_ID=44440 /ORGANISM="Chattonella subsalsa, Strain CCMP2191" /LENGTH=95 /DNA_ID=CAMNT_0005552073 /DNA_START=47 /DNA_END=331 /DNA_ORIENTATION=-